MRRSIKLYMVYIEFWRLEVYGLTDIEKLLKPSKVVSKIIYSKDRDRNRENEDLKVLHL